MPRDGSGTYTLPAGNPVISGTVIDVTWANPTMDDIASSLTDSLSRTGSGGMLVPLPFADGTVSLPGITWLNNPNMGFYRPGVDEMRVSVAAVDKARWTTTAGVPMEIFIGGGWAAVLSDLIDNPQDLTFRGPTTTNTMTLIASDVAGGITGAGGVSLLRLLGTIDTLHILDSTDTDTLSLEHTGTQGLIQVLTGGGSLRLESDDGQVQLAHAGTPVLITDVDGVNLRGNVSGAIPQTYNTFLELRNGDGSAVIGEVGFESAFTDAFIIRSRNNDRNVQLWGRNAGGSDRALADMDPDGSVSLYQAAENTINFRTRAAASGGAQVRNTLTGSGLERVATESDIGGGAATGTFIPTYTGFAAPPANQFRWTKVGGWAFMINNSGNIATSNATTMTITNLPTDVRPQVAVRMAPCVVRDNGADLYGVAFISTGGVITFGTAFVGGGFTASGSKGTPAQFYMYWPLTSPF